MNEHIGSRMPGFIRQAIVMVVDTGPAIRCMTKNRCRGYLELAEPARNGRGASILSGRSS